MSSYQDGPHELKEQILLVKPAVVIAIVYTTSAARLSKPTPTQVFH